MRAGLLRSRITIEVPTKGQDAYGAVTQTWSTLTTRWAQVAIKGGKEGELAGAVRAQSDVEFIVRKLAGVTEEMRVQYDGRTYQITHVASDQWGKTTRLLARAVT